MIKAQLPDVQRVKAQKALEAQDESKNGRKCREKYGRTLDRNVRRQIIWDA